MSGPLVYFIYLWWFSRLLRKMQIWPLGDILNRNWCHRWVPRHRFPISGPLTVFVYRWRFRVFRGNINLTARWRLRPEMTSPLDSPIRFPISGPLTFFVYLHSSENYWHILILAGEILFVVSFVKIALPKVKFLTCSTLVSCCTCRAASTELLFVWIGSVVRKS
jgi:hypothetical protein